MGMSQLSDHTMLFISDPAGTYSQAGSRVGPIPPRVVARLETQTEDTLRALYLVVAQDLAAEFVEMRTQARHQAALLLRAAGITELEHPAAVRVEINALATRTAWYPVARAATLELLRAALALAGSVTTASPCSCRQWAQVTIADLDRAGFAELTGLEYSEPDRTIWAAARAICSWGALAARMPLLMQGTCLTVRRA